MPSDVAKEINEIYPGAIDKRTVQRWFKKFREGDFNLDRKRRSGELKVFEDEELKELIEDNPNFTLHEYASFLGVSHVAVWKRMRAIEFTCKKTLWVPHKLTDDNKRKRVTTCQDLLERNNQNPFLSRMVTMDEKWILYTNVQRKREWSLKGKKPSSVPKAGLHPQKLLLSAWWDIHGLIYFELLKAHERINGEFYCHQLDRFHAALKQKRPHLANRGDLYYHQDNARPHTALITTQKFKSLGYKMVPHPPYSPDIAPSDYYLFRSLQNDLNGRSFKTYNDVKTYIEEFFQSKLNKDRDFFKKGILKLPGLWQETVERGGEYA